MRFNLLLVLSLGAQISLAQVEMNPAELTKSEITLKVTGEDAIILKKLTSDYDGKPDMYLSKGADKEDSSSLRLVKCEATECTIVMNADIFSNKSTEDYYAKALNKKLLALDANQRLVTSPIRESAGRRYFYDARLLKLLQENRNEIKNIKLQFNKLGNITEAERVSNLLYTLRLKMNKINLVCYSTLVTGMGITNFLEEVCSIEAIVDVK